MEYFLGLHRGYLTTQGTPVTHYKIAILGPQFTQLPTLIAHCHSNCTCICHQVTISHCNTTKIKLLVDFTLFSGYTYTRIMYIIGHFLPLHAPLPHNSQCQLARYSFYFGIPSPATSHNTEQHYTNSLNGREGDSVADHIDTHPTSTVNTPLISHLIFYCIFSCMYVCMYILQFYKIHTYTGHTYNVIHTMSYIRTYINTHTLPYTGHTQDIHT